MMVMVVVMASYYHGLAMMDRHRRRHQNENSDQAKRGKDSLASFKICLNLAIFTFSNLNAVRM